MRTIPRALNSMLAACCILAGTNLLHAQSVITLTDVPRTISYQGALTNPDGTAIPDGSYPITLALYSDPNGATKVWQDTYSAPVIGGIFNLYLGGGNSPLPDPATMNRPLWVGIQLGDAPPTGSLTPLAASPYALNISNGAITTSKLADGAVTKEKTDLDYISAIAVNGAQVTGKGTVLNIEGSDDIALSYNDATNTLRLSKPAAATKDQEKGISALAGTGTDIVWSLGGDAWNTTTPGSVQPAAGDWIGTSNPGVTFEMRTNGETIMRYQPNGTNTPNIVGGNVANSLLATSSGSVIAGGGSTLAPNSIDDDAVPANDAIYSVIAGGLGNNISADFASIGGGDYNTIAPTADHGTIAGGNQNDLYGQGSAIGGGYDHTANGNYSTIGGGYVNSTSNYYSTVGGGRENNATDDYATVGGGNLNDASSDWATVGGGYDNDASNDYTTIGGGKENDASGMYATVGGGANHIASGNYSTVGGGAGNTSSHYATVGGGELNNAAGNVSTVGGGSRNTSSGYYSVISGGRSNTTFTDYNTIGGGFSNTASNDYTTVAGGQENQALDEHDFVGGGYNNVASGGRSTIAGGANHIANKVYSFIGGGAGNTASGEYSTVGGGGLNVASGNESAITGGYDNDATGAYSTVGGGKTNVASGDYSAIVGGESNTASGAHSLVGGGISNTAAGPNAIIGGGTSNAISTTSTNATIGGGEGNSIATTTYWSTIAGGHGNKTTASHNFIGGGHYNTASGEAAAIGGGRDNNATDISAFIGGGDLNDASNDYTTVAGGYDNNATNDYAAIGGGKTNAASGSYSFIGSGESNQALGSYSTVGGGTSNEARLDYSFVGGGQTNRATGYKGVVVGGDNNTASGSNAFIGAGTTNTAGGAHSVIGGGANNVTAANYSAIAGGQQNNIDPGQTGSFIGGGLANAISANGFYAGTLGGDNLQAQTYTESAVGFYNAPRGTLAAQPASLLARRTINDPLFMVGNGVPATVGGATVRSNAFEVSYNGHSVVYDVNGTSILPAGRAVIKGATYVDNIIYSWGHITAAGGITSDIGIGNVAHTGPGVYAITLRMVDPTGAPVNLANAAITATLINETPGDAGACKLIYVTPIAPGTNTFQVYVRKVSDCQGVDGAFMFHVTGR